MALIDDLNQSVTELSASVTSLQADLDTKQQAIADAIAALEQTIADLQGQLNQGGATAAQLQVLLDQVSAIKTNLAATDADLNATPTA